MSDSSNAKVQVVVAKLHRTSDGLNPAIREAQDRAEKRSRQRIITSFSVLSAATNFIQSVALLVAVWFLAHVAPHYFAIDHGRIIRLYALDEPYRTPADVIAYAKTTMDRTFALDFSNYQMQLEDVRPLYTQEGFKNLIDAMKSNGTLELIRTQRMNLTSSTGTGVLINEGVENGVYTWTIRLPQTLKLVGQTKEMPDQHVMATIKVRRVPTLDSVEGIGVSQTVTTPM